MLLSLTVFLSSLWMKEHFSSNLHLPFILYVAHSEGCQWNHNQNSRAFPSCTCSKLAGLFPHLSRLLQKIDLSLGREIVLDFFRFPFSFSSCPKLHESPFGHGPLESHWEQSPCVFSRLRYLSSPFSFYSSSLSRSATSPRIEVPVFTFSVRGICAPYLPVE